MGMSSAQVNEAINAFRGLGKVNMSSTKPQRSQRKYAKGDYPPRFSGFVESFRTAVTAR